MTLKRSLDLKSGHTIGLLNEGVELVTFENTDIPKVVVAKLHATGEYSQIRKVNLEDKSEAVIKDKIIYLNVNEVVYFGENVSILMTRHNYEKFRIVIETEDAGTVVSVRKHSRLFRTGKQDDPNEHPYKLYEISQPNKQRRFANQSKTRSY